MDIEFSKLLRTVRGAFSQFLAFSVRKGIVMSMFIISYDLQKAGQSYQRLYDKLHSLGVACRAMDSTWLLLSSLSATTIRDRIRDVTDDNDLIWVSEVGYDYAGWLDTKVWEWLASHSQTI